MLKLYGKRINCGQVFIWRGKTVLQGGDAEHGERNSPQLGVCCCSMYWRMTQRGAPAQLPAKWLGDHNAPPQSILRMVGYFFWRIMRLDTVRPATGITGKKTGVRRDASSALIRAAAICISDLRLCAAKPGPRLIPPSTPACRSASPPPSAPALRAPATNGNSRPPDAAPPAQWPCSDPRSPCASRHTFPASGSAYAAWW